MLAAGVFGSVMTTVAGVMLQLEIPLASPANSAS
jgi:hypothetical protein